MPPGDLSREELIELVALIMRGDAREDAVDRLVRLFEESVVHPRAVDLIFYPDMHFGPEYRDKTPTPEQVVDVDAALAYKPIHLGPGD